MKTILIVNPNSSAPVTESIAATVSPLETAGVRFAVEGIAEGPLTIATDEDVARAGLAFAARVADRPADAYVTACFSDPGLDLARGLQDRPVIGIQEAGILTALGRADMFGIIALGPAALGRHRRKIRMMGVESRFAGELALPGVSAEASGRDPQVYAMCLDLGRTLRDMGAGSVVLGCAGMAPIRARLERDIGVPIIDPVTAAAVMALGAVI